MFCWPNMLCTVFVCLIAAIASGGAFAHSSQGSGSQPVFAVPLSYMSAALWTVAIMGRPDHGNSFGCVLNARSPAANSSEAKELGKRLLKNDEFVQNETSKFHRCKGYLRKYNCSAQLRECENCRDYGVYHAADGLMPSYAERNLNTVRALLTTNILLEQDEVDKVRVLDVGSGSGWFVWALRTFGINADGLQPIGGYRKRYMTQLLNVEPVQHLISAHTPLPRPFCRYTLVTMFLICFDDGWDVEAWDYYLTDLACNFLTHTPPGRALLMTQRAEAKKAKYPKTTLLHAVERRGIFSIRASVAAKTLSQVLRYGSTENWNTTIELTLRPHALTRGMCSRNPTE